MAKIGQYLKKAKGLGKSVASNLDDVVKGDRLLRDSKRLVKEETKLQRNFGKTSGFNKQNTQRAQQQADFKKGFRKESIRESVEGDFDKAVDKLPRQLEKAGKNVADFVDSKPLSPFKDAPQGRILGNAFTGKKVNEPLVAGAVIGAGALFAATNNTGSIFDTQSRVETHLGEMGEGSTSPSLTADGLENAPTKSNAPTLGAQGSMLFGMHNKRHG